MPVPKRKTSKARRDQRSSSWFIRPQAIALCMECDAPNNPHQVCTECGFYKGRKVMITKRDRSVKRMEARQKAQAKQPAEQAGEDNS